MKWIEPKPTVISEEIESAYGGTFLLPRLLTRQGISNLSEARIFLAQDPYPISSPFDLPQMDKAIDRLKDARLKGEKIAVWGDFDVDGQTSTALLTEGLRNCGFDVAFRVPIRSQESHGIRKEYLERFLLQEKPDLLITCDTGISEFSAFDFLLDQGIDAIITDHHTPGEKIPPVLACINPHFLPADHPMRCLAGVGTAYQLIRAFSNHFKLDPGGLMDLVALGTIADVAELTGENRHLVRDGLRRINASPRKSIAQLVKYIDLKTTFINESHISFGIAPRMNASGRLDNANGIVNFLLSEDEQVINKTVQFLETLNTQRKLTVKLIYESALEIISKNEFLTRYPVLILSKENWPGGVLGIVASRLAEKFNKPVFLFSIENNIAKGSARSVQGVDIYSLIQEIRSLIINGGGHAMAAGLSIKAEQIHEFREQLSLALIRRYPGIHRESELIIDGFIDIGTIIQMSKSDIGLLAPFGAGNPAPVLAFKNISVANFTIFGRKKDHRKINLIDRTGQTVEVVWWNASDEQMPEGEFDLAFSFKPGAGFAHDEMTLEWRDFREAEKADPLLVEENTKYKFFDFRRSPGQKQLISELIKNDLVLAWGEGINVKENLHPRSQLFPSKKLALLFPPASRDILSQILATVNPSEIYLFNLSPVYDSISSITTKILGLIKFQINHNKGLIDLKKFSEATGQDEKTITLALNWYAASGKVRFYEVRNNTHASLQNCEPQGNERQIRSALQQMLDETNAYRAFFLRASPQQIFSGL